VSPVVLYLERQGAGSVLRRVRLVGPGLDEAWSPPTEEVIDEQRVVETDRQAVRWVVERLRAAGLRRELGAVCLDTDGALCLWASLPSTNPTVVAASLAQLRSQSGEAETEGAGGGLLTAVSDGVGTDRSIQVLCPSDDCDSPPQPAGEGTHAPAEPARRRLGVLSVPDVPARVILDELDRLGVGVDRVVSFWHAAAEAWDSRSSAAPDSPRVAASQSVTTAVVVLDPSGRMVWSWSIDGAVAAAGSMRLRSTLHAEPPPVDPGGDGLARRVAEPAPEPTLLVACGAPEAARLTADWLAWSSQLGTAPARIVLVGPQILSGEGPGASLGVAAQALGRLWPSATLDAVAHDDPVGATLARLARGTPERGVGTPAGIVELTERPGRPHRAWYRWAAVLVASAGVALGVLGHNMAQAAGRVLGKRAELASELTTALKGAEDLVPGLSSKPEPSGPLRGMVNQLRQSRADIEPERPVLGELSLLLTALMEEEEPVKLDEVNLGDLSATARLLAPNSEAVPRVAARLRQADPVGAYRLIWRASAASFTSALGEGQPWVLEGNWTPVVPAGESGARRP